MSTTPDWTKDLEELREEFEELFPKDKEASKGIRPSKSNRSAALVLWSRFEMILRKAASKEKEITGDWEKDTQKFLEQFINRTCTTKNCEGCKYDMEGIIDHIHTLLTAERDRIARIVENASTHFITPSCQEDIVYRICKGSLPN